jgi:hypothetical protein
MALFQITWLLTIEWNQNDVIDMQRWNGQHQSKLLSDDFQLPMRASDAHACI